MACKDEQGGRGLGGGGVVQNSGNLSQRAFWMPPKLTTK